MSAMFAVYVPIGPSRMGKIHISDVLNGHVMGCNGVYYPNVLRNIVLQVTFFFYQYYNNRSLRALL